MTRHPSPVHFPRPDPKPDESLVKMLAAFIDYPWPQTRREAEERAFGHTAFTATWAVHALRSLRDAGYIERLPLSDTKYRPTAKGRAALGVFRACEPEGAA